MKASRRKRLERAKMFEDWHEAFDYCREQGGPVDVAVEDSEGIEYAHIFPGGRCETFHEERKCNI